MRRLPAPPCARSGLLAGAVGLALAMGCASPQRPAHDRAARAERARGCPLQVFTEAPPMPTENIGPVRARCDREDPDEICMRELKDQACLLGADVLWQIEGPEVAGDQKRVSGRAAHTRP